MKNIKLGSKVRDNVTTLEGFAMARLEYLNGCIRYEVQPQELKDGKPVGATWVDLQQLEVVEVADGGKKKTKVGGPGSVPPKHQLPS